MAKVSRVRADGLQLEEPTQFQQRFWVVQRIVWGFFIAIILAALAGFSGNGGPFSQVSRQFRLGTVEAPLVSRRAISDTLAVTLIEPASSLILSRVFTDEFEISSIFPMPQRVVAVPGGERLEFSAEGSDRRAIVIDLRPRRFGLKRYTITIAGETQSFSTFILP